MKASYFLLCGLAGVLFAGTGFLAADDYSANATAASAPIYVPDLSHANEPLPDGVLAWNSLAQSTNVPADSDQAHFLLSFTNVSSGNVSISDVHPTCGCTTADLPPLPWTIPPGGGGQIPVTVNLSLNITGDEGTLLKAVNVSTDKGSKQLLLRINFLPPVIPHLTDAERANGMAIAKTDRQAIFKTDCATCHAKATAGRYGKALYDAVCAVCHEADQRAEAVPDLHNLKTPTNVEYWRTWIAHGKAGSLMPAFATAEGGPLNDMQIASLAAYLNNWIPPRVPPAQ